MVFNVYFSAYHSRVKVSFIPETGHFESKLARERGKMFDTFRLVSTCATNNETDV